MIKKIATILLAAIPAMTIASEPIVNLAPVTVKQVRINDSFWSPKRETNRTASIPHSIKMLYDVGYIRNFELAAQGKREGYSGPIFMDSDAYKVIEAAAYSLATHPDPQLEKQIDEIIDKIAAAQMQDGYLNSWYQVNAPDQRWTDLRNAHELYCAGHLIEA
ncbi:MAG TPA: glycoside hydrolase family 127 protein, partial [Armatimonadota bacterium]|nr:glycoside hydrolase family 127 protein [Armatimonadota bacterium]